MVIRLYCLLKSPPRAKSGWSRKLTNGQNKVTKMTIEIKENGWVFVMEEGRQERGKCSQCKAIDRCCPGTVVEILCADTETHICKSAAKITEEAKVYGPHNWKDAQKFIGKHIQYWSDRLGTWDYGIMQGILHTSPIYRMDEKDGQGNMIISAVIREIPTLSMTWPVLREAYGIPDNVVLEEGNDE